MSTSPSHGGTGSESFIKQSENNVDFQQLIIKFLEQPNSYPHILEGLGYKHDEGNLFKNNFKSKLLKQKPPNSLFRKILAIIIQLIFFSLTCFLLYFSYHSDWIHFTNACVIFLCLFIYELFNFLPVMAPVFNEKMINILKMLFYLGICVLFIFLSMNDTNIIDSNIGKTIYGTIFGFFLAIIVSLELKKFCSKILS